MNQRYGTNGTGNGRIQWGGYGFIAGIVLGVLIGWFFAGFIWAFIRVGMVALVVIPAVLLFIGWRKYVAPMLRSPVQREPMRHEYIDPGYAIETRAVVHGTEREPLPR
ncbi:MAG: hypothetical protein K0S78_48 [Thermomicrobiales bacterium]|jgi:hypothetical protein|nr:hypothetical protein [Thermomicrobiales bacterium]MDF3039853.1 hypothetical protein [Thermomicrobiales bacterium]